MVRWRLRERRPRPAPRRKVALVLGAIGPNSGASRRLAVGGLLGERDLRPGQRRVISLESLTAKLQVRGPNLTPGSVAAHALKRRLATRAMAKVKRQNREASLREQFVQALPQTSSTVSEDAAALWANLKVRGTITRLLNSSAPEGLLSQAIAVIHALPKPVERKDRRHLANTITRNPHALDHGSALASVVMSILTCSGHIEQGLRPRSAWAAVGVACDDVLGGLIMLGVLPADWHVPPGVLITIPPRVLGSCDWPSPATSNDWIFVTENPSILLAAAERAEQGTILRLVCTCGTPSAVEIGALARMSQSGWRFAVRADFDSAGIEHVNAMLKGISGALAWRMTTSDYLESIQQDSTEGVKLDSIPDTPWDSNLAETMRRFRFAGFEESLLPALLEDLSRGSPTSLIG